MEKTRKRERRRNQKLKKIIDKQDEKIEQLEGQQNELKTEAEMARVAAEKTRREYAKKKECAAWLKDSLEKTAGTNGQG